jgi:hypothetical protein
MDVNQISSLFISKFEDFINKSSLGELERITGYALIKGLGNELNPKLQFLNQGVNSKELILFFLLLTMENVKEHFSDYSGDVTEELIELFKRFSHIRIKWSSGSESKIVHSTMERGNKRQLSVKSRGTYYTPKFMSNFMCKESIQTDSLQKIHELKEIVQEISKGTSKFDIQNLANLIPIRVVDLSMGIGNFLCDSIPYLIKHVQTCKKIITNSLIPLISETGASIVFKTYPFLADISKQTENRQLGEFIFHSCLYGIEIDPTIQKMAKIVVSLKIQSLIGIQIDSPPNLICKNTVITVLNTPKNTKIKKIVEKLNGFIFIEQFPEVFTQDNGGFDIILGNPPWEILKPNNREFFGNYEIDFLRSTRSRQDILQNQLLMNLSIRNTFEKYIDKIISQINAISFLEYSHQTSRIQENAFSGDPQLFKFFLEIAFKVVKNGGIISLIVQHNFLGSKSCADLRSLYIDNGKFHGIWEFYNKIHDEIFFQNVDPNQRFIVFQFQKLNGFQSEIHYKKCYSVEDLNMYFLPYQSIPIDFYKKISNEELQLFGFVTKEHRSVFEKVIATKNDLSNLTWKKGTINVKFSQDLHVTRDRDKFSLVPTSFPIYGGRSFGPFYFQPINERFLIENKLFSLKLPERSIICRNILPNSAKRIIFSIPPGNAIVDNSCTRLFLENKDDDVLLFVLAISNSLLVENFLRTILTGMNLNYYLIRRIPIPSPTAISEKKYANLITELTKIVKKLPLIPLETKEWADIYAEIEAIIAFLFKLTKNELKVILDSFDFSRLQKTKLSGFKPFQKLSKATILDYFESLSSRLTK